MQDRWSGMQWEILLDLEDLILFGGQPDHIGNFGAVGSCDRLFERSTFFSQSRRAAVPNGEHSLRIALI